MSHLYVKSVISYAFFFFFFCLNLTQGRLYGALNETRTHKGLLVAQNKLICNNKELFYLLKKKSK